MKCILTTLMFRLTPAKGQCIRVVRTLQFVFLYYLALAFTVNVIAIVIDCYVLVFSFPFLFDVYYERGEREKSFAFVVAISITRITSWHTNTRTIPNIEI